MQGSAIAIEGLSREFLGSDGQTPLLVLDDIDLAIRPGEFVSFIGESGCGKTTLLKMVGGLVATEVGRIDIDGSPVSKVPPSIGFVFQEPALLPWRSVVGNIELALKYRKLPREENRAITDRLLEATGLTDFASYPPYKLSGGMQQRVGLARALSADPRLLLMDEPFGALDALTRVRLQEELGQMVTGGTTVLFVTHDVDEALFLSDRIVVMATRPGRIRAVLDVPGSRPRTRLEFAGNPAYLELRVNILRLIEGESAAPVPS